MYVKAPAVAARTAVLKHYCHWTSAWLSKSRGPSCGTGFPTELWVVDVVDDVFESLLCVDLQHPGNTPLSFATAVCKRHSSVRVYVCERTADQWKLRELCRFEATCKYDVVQRTRTCIGTWHHVYCSITSCFEACTSPLVHSTWKYLWCIKPPSIIPHKTTSKLSCRAWYFRGAVTWCIIWRSQASPLSVWYMLIPAQSETNTTGAPMFWFFFLPRHGCVLLSEDEQLHEIVAVAQNTQEYFTS